MTTEPQNPEVEEETWEQKIERHMAEKGYTDLDDPEQKRKFSEREVKRTFIDQKSTPAKRAEAKANFRQALSNLDDGKTSLALPNTRQQAIKKAEQISKGIEFVNTVKFHGAKPPASESKPTIRKNLMVQKPEKPKAEIVNKPKTPSKPLENVKATNAPKTEVKATESKITAQNKPVINVGFDPIKEKQGLALEQVWIRFKRGGMSVNDLLREIQVVIDMALTDAYLQFEVIAAMNNTTIEEIIKAGRRHG